jgi:hypothetical protein
MLAMSDVDVGDIVNAEVPTLAVAPAEAGGLS